MLPIEDEIIIDRYIVRDEKAISYTADKYGKQLVAIANRICDDLDIAEECENDTYLRAWNSIPPHEPRGCHNPLNDVRWFTDCFSRRFNHIHVNIIHSF